MANIIAGHARNLFLVIIIRPAKNMLDAPLLRLSPSVDHVLGRVTFVSRDASRGSSLAPDMLVCWMHRC